MKGYKMYRGETLEERIPDMEAMVENYFGPITGTEEFRGSDLYAVGEPKNPVLTRIVAGAIKYNDKRGELAVNFEEAGLADLVPEDLEAVGEAVSVKSGFLLEATSRDTKSRRDSMRRAVEDGVPDV